MSISPLFAEGDIRQECAILQTRISETKSSVLLLNLVNQEQKTSLNELHRILGNGRIQLSYMLQRQRHVSSIGFEAEKLNLLKRLQARLERIITTETQVSRQRFPDVGQFVSGTSNPETAIHEIIEAVIQSIERAETLENETKDRQRTLEGQMNVTQILRLEVANLEREKMGLITRIYQTGLQNPSNLNVSQSTPFNPSATHQSQFHYQMDQATSFLTDSSQVPMNGADVSGMGFQQLGAPFDYHQRSSAQYLSNGASVHVAPQSGIYNSPPPDNSRVNTHCVSEDTLFESKYSTFETPQLSEFGNTN